jgi:hypothetical protein
MAKPAITKYGVKGSPLTTSELDTNFQNIVDATVSLTAGTGGTAVSTDLNGNITLVAGTNITLTGNNTAKTITITSSGGGSLTSSDSIEIGQDDTDLVQIFANAGPSFKSIQIATNAGPGLSSTQLFLDGNGGTTTLQANGILELGAESYIYNNSTVRQGTQSSGTISSGSYTPDWNNYQIILITLSNNTTFNAPTNFVSGATLELIIRQDSTGSRTATWNSAYKFVNGSKTLSTAANAIDRVTIFYDGTNYLCELKTNYS